MTKEKHFELSDSSFEKQFLNCQLDSADFTHVAHLRLAWINIDRYGIQKAEKKIVAGLKKFVEFAGEKNKFNMTLTLAAMRAVYKFKLQSKSDNFNEFILEFPRLETHFKDLIACHYGFDIYNSARAKKEFLEPDLLAFD